MSAPQKWLNPLGISKISCSLTDVTALFQSAVAGLLMVHWK